MLQGLNMTHIAYDSYRYINWAFFVLAAAINGIPTQAFSGVTPIITRVYQITQFESNIPAFTYPLSYVFLILPANYILDKKGLKVGTLICQICMIAGLSLRLFINVHYYLFCLGTFICSLGFCFMFGGANQFANIWFPHHQIFLVSSVCILALFASDALGTLLSSLFIKQESSRENIFNFFLWESLIMITIHLLAAIFLRGKPKNLQNYASASKRNSFREDLRTIIHNKNYLVLFLCTTFVFSAIAQIFVFIPWIGKAYDFETKNNGFFIISAFIGGIFGCISVIFFAKSLSYKKKINLLAFGSIVAVAFIVAAFEFHSLIFSYICAALFGFMVYPLLSTLSDFATQTTFPAGEATSSGILMFGGQTSGVLLSVIFSFIFNGQSLNLTRVLNGIITFLLLMGFITSLFAQQILQRQKYQTQKEKQILFYQPNFEETKQSDHIIN